MTFVVLHVFLTAIPLLSTAALHLIRTMCALLLKESAAANLVINALEFIIDSIYFLSRLIGNLGMAILYGWYGFDYHWALDGDLGKKRFERVEVYWAYFLGFGLPYLLIVRSTSFLVGYGIYLILFPFTIVLCVDADCTQGKELYLKSGINPLQIFTIPKYCTDRALAYVLPAAAAKEAKKNTTAETTDKSSVQKKKKN